jgi:hypothetical protein
VDPAVVNLQVALDNTFDAATLTRFAFTTPHGPCAHAGTAQ